MNLSRWHRFCMKGSFAVLYCFSAWERIVNFVLRCAAQGKRRTGPASIYEQQMGAQTEKRVGRKYCPVSAKKKQSENTPESVPPSLLPQRHVSYASATRLWKTRFMRVVWRTDWGL